MGVAATPRRGIGSARAPRRPARARRSRTASSAAGNAIRQRRPRRAARDLPVASRAPAAPARPREPRAASATGPPGRASAGRAWAGAGRQHLRQVHDPVEHRPPEQQRLDDEPRIGAPADGRLAVGEQAQHAEDVARLEPIAMRSSGRAWPSVSPSGSLPSCSMSSARSVSPAPFMNSARSAPASTSRSTSGNTPAGRRSATRPSTSA